MPPVGKFYLININILSCVHVGLHGEIYRINTICQVCKCTCIGNLCARVPTFPFHYDYDYVQLESHLFSHNVWQVHPIHYRVDSVREIWQAIITCTSCSRSLFFSIISLWKWDNNHIHGHVLISDFRNPNTYLALSAVPLFSGWIMVAAECERAHSCVQIWLM